MKLPWILSQEFLLWEVITKICIYLTMPGFLWGNLDLRSLWGHAGSSSQTRDQTRVPCIGSVESYTLDHQGNPRKAILKWPLKALSALRSKVSLLFPSFPPWGLIHCWVVTHCILFFFSSSYFNLRFSDYWGLASRCLLTLLRSAWTWFLPSFLLGVLSFSYWHDTNMICMIYSVYSMCM